METGNRKRTLTLATGPKIATASVICTYKFSYLIIALILNNLSYYNNKLKITSRKLRSLHCVAENKNNYVYEQWTILIFQVVDVLVVVWAEIIIFLNNYKTKCSRQENTTFWSLKPLKYFRFFEFYRNAQLEKCLISQTN